MKDYEKMVKTKNEEIKTLHMQISELQKVNKTSIENEIRRLGNLLTEADTKIQQKDEEIALLTAKINESPDVKNSKKEALYIKGLETENEELRKKVQELEKMLQNQEETKKAEEKPKTDISEITHKMQKELAASYKDIVNLSKTITGILKGEEPNMQSLWGITNGTKEIISENEELSLEDLGNLKMAIDTIRTNICDYYAEKYSNECNLQ